MKIKFKSENIVYGLLINLLAFALWQAVNYRYEFGAPLFIWGLLLIPILSVWYFFKSNNIQAKITITSLKGFQVKKINWLAFLRPSLYGLRQLALTLIILCLARPQSRLSFQDVNTEGIDIVIVTDISASMLAKDFKPNRLEASKEVAQEFIKTRHNDRIGLVVYEGQAFTQCPLTTDHRVLHNLLDEVKTGMIEGGTAIGMGLATAVNRLRESESKSKVIILLTDGVNNMGSISPVTAAEIAKEFGVKVYTIGVGTQGKALSPVAMYPDGSYRYDYMDVEIDELSLQKIALLTKGKYFRATDNKSLEDIYAEIDKLEKTEIKVTEISQKKDEFMPLALFAIGLLGLELLLNTTLFRTVP